MKHTLTLFLVLILAGCGTKQAKTAAAEDLDAQLKQRTLDYATKVSQGRRMMGSIGFNEGQILSDARKARGKRVIDDFSEAEKEEILLDAFKAKYDYKLFMQSPEVTQKLAAYTAGTEEHSKAQMLYAMEAAIAAIDEPINRIKDMEEKARAARANWTGAEREAHKQKLEASRAAFESARGRGHSGSTPQPPPPQQLSEKELAEQKRMDEIRGVPAWQNEIKKPNQPAPAAPPVKPAKVFKMKDGSELAALTAITMDGKITIKDVEGKKHVINETDVAEVITPK